MRTDATPLSSPIPQPSALVFSDQAGWYCFGAILLAAMQEGFADYDHRAEVPFQTARGPAKNGESACVSFLSSNPQLAT